jgi:8-oxo-dGTP diphosphatase
VTLLRDDKPGLPWANMWDLPGGGREADETPLDCLIREVREEVGLDLTGMTPATAQHWPSATTPALRSWFFTVHLPAIRAADLRLGDEGQEIALMTPHAFLAHPGAIPFLKDRLRAALQMGGKSVYP